MRKFVCLAFFLLQSFFVPSSSAALCSSGPLAGYLATGFSCTIGSLDFSEFKLLEQPTGALPFSSIVINPMTSAPNEFGLEFLVNQNAAAPSLFEQLIGYRVTGIGSSIDRNTLFFTGASATGDAAVSALEQKCLAGVFAGLDGVTGCTGTALDLAVLAIEGLPPDPPIFADFASVAFLTVVADIAVDAGETGTAALTSATNLFRTVGPAIAVSEPTSGALAALSLLLLWALRRRAASR